MPSKIPTNSLFDISEAARRSVSRLKKASAVKKANKPTTKKKRADPKKKVAPKKKRITTKRLARELDKGKQWLTQPARIKPASAKQRIPSRKTTTTTPSFRKAGPIGGAVEGIVLIPVISSNVAAYGYNKEEEKLYVQFLDGSIYLYSDVEEDTWLRFQTAPSKGKFVWSDLRDRYAYDRIR